MPTHDDVAGARPRTAPRIAAGCAPVACLLIFIVLAVALAGGAREAFEVVRGTRGFLVLIAALPLALAAGGVIAVSAARPVPASIALALACVPWWLGDVLGLNAAGADIGSTEVEYRASALAGAVTSALMEPAVGAFSSAALFAGVGLGCALASVAPVGERRSVGAAVGTSAVVPLLAVLVATVALMNSASGASFAGAGVVTLLGVFTCALAGWGATHDEPHARAARLAAVAGAAQLGALAAAMAVVPVFGATTVFHAIAFAEPDRRPEVITAGAAELVPSVIVSLGLPIVALVPALALAAWSASRARPTPGALVSATVVAIALAFTVAAHALTMHLCRTTLEPATAGLGAVHLLLSPW